MDSINIPLPASNQGFTPQAKVPSPSPAPANPVPSQAAAPSPAFSAPKPTGDAAIEAAIRQAALSFKDTYAVSDREFTIFKDATGKFITRYVSLRDGSVTYVPEPAMIKSTPTPVNNFRLAIDV